MWDKPGATMYRYAVYSNVLTKPANESYDTPLESSSHVHTV
jgi:hypothetical protein